MLPSSDQEVEAVDSASPNSKGNHEEVRWTDDSIRWEGGLHVKTSSVDDNETGIGIDGKKSTTHEESSDDEDYIIDPFKDPDPFEIFSFKFQLPEYQHQLTNNNNYNESNYNSTLNIHIRGYKPDADEVWQSTGLTLWRASHYLCEYQIENHRKLFQNNKRTLELGAGLGLNGILAWKLMKRSNDDSSHVCITDGDSDALVQLRDNVKRNRTSANESDDADADDGKVSCHQLIWGKESATQFLTQIAKNQKYDVIIASDIIYSLVIVEPLWQTAQLLLKKEGGIFVMAYARREVPVSIELVLKASIAHGFSYELVKENATDGIWVYEFRHANHEAASS